MSILNLKKGNVGKFKIGISIHVGPSSSVGGLRKIVNEIHRVSGWRIIEARDDPAHMTIKIKIDTGLCQMGTSFIHVYLPPPSVLRIVGVKYLETGASPFPRI